MSEISVTCKKVYSVKGLDREDLDLLVSVLIRVAADLKQPDLGKAINLIEVLE